MRFDTTMNVQAGQTAATDAQLDKLLKRAKSDAAGATPSSKEDAKIAKAGRDFESILLGSWLQQAENSFGTVPGGDGEDEDDSGKEQFQGISMQALAGKLADSGGIGIAKMITSHLHAAATKTEKGAESVGKAENSEKKTIS